MAKSSKRIIFPLWPGLIVALITLLLAVTTLASLFMFSPLHEWQHTITDRYLWHIIRFSFWQALLSTLLSVLPAIIISRALANRIFIARNLLIKLCSLTLIIPTLVAIFGILTIFGRHGWLSIIFSWFKQPYQLSIYGIMGILLAHVFFNLPLAVRFFLPVYESINAEQNKIAAQLGMSKWHYFKLVEWQQLKRYCFPIITLIFMLCFTSFSIVLTLGGGPKATTIELAIYQAIIYDFDLGKGAILAIIQLICCFFLLLLSYRSHPSLTGGQSIQQHKNYLTDHWYHKLFDGFCIVILILIILPPIIAVVVKGINPYFIQVLQQPLLWQAVLTSMKIAIIAGILAVLFALMLLWSSRECRHQQAYYSAQCFESCSMLIFAMPSIVLATGLFLLLNDTIGVPQSAEWIIITTNTFIALPFTIKILSPPFHEITRYYYPLIQSLGLKGIPRLYWIEGKVLRTACVQAFTIAGLLSFSDFSSIALFGNGDFYTLPYYLYQQISAYRSHEAGVTALLLLLISFFLFMLIEKLAMRHNR